MSTPAMTEREKVLLAATTGAGASPNWLTSDMVDALLGGHGMLNIAVINAAEVIIHELKGGMDNKLRFANAASQPVDEILAKAIRAAVQAGAAPANAALIAAVLMYLTGTKAQVGIPAGNRKLDKMKSTGRIDGLVALAIAMGVMPSVTKPAPKFQLFVV